MFNNFYYSKYKDLFIKSYRVYKEQGLKVLIQKAFRFLAILGFLPHFSYYFWIKKNEIYVLSDLQKDIDSFKDKPVISVIMPVYNIAPRYLNKAIESILNQSYPYWELCIYDDASTNKKTVEALLLWQKKDSRIKIKFGKVNKHISYASNKAIEMATGKYLAFVDHDDTIAHFAFYEIIKKFNQNPEIEFIYSDEDFISKNGLRSSPLFKPDWSLDLLLTNMYICHLSVYLREKVIAIGGLREGYEGAQDYDLILRYIQTINEKNIFHIRKILYHWRILKSSTSGGNVSAKPYAVNAGKKALEDFTKRSGLDVSIENTKYPFIYRFRRKLVLKDKVTIIICFKKLKYLENCLISLIEKTNYHNYEIALIHHLGQVDSVSKEDLFLFLNKLNTDIKINYFEYYGDFNYSLMHNKFIPLISNEYILLLNDDTQVVEENWLYEMMSHIVREEVGVVGAKLLYFNNSIQHAGVALGLFDSIPFHIRGDDLFIRNYSAVTGACLLTKKSLYLSVSGMDEENLPVQFNDIDYCLKIREKGLLVVYTPYSVLYHYESASRKDNYLKNLKESMLSDNEYIYFSNKWKKYATHDQYFNSNTLFL